jgi:hypothetical protein
MGNHLGGILKLSLGQETTQAKVRSTMMSIRAPRGEQ